MSRAAPLVSILIPVYNRVGLILESIQSALAQTHPNIEVVVVDNCSDDGTFELLEQTARLDPRLRVFRNAENIGPVRNWLACVAQARGEFAKILWSDDLMAPDFVARCLAAMASDRIGFVYTAARTFADRRALLDGPVSYATLPTGTYPSSLYIEKSLLGSEFPMSPGCALFRRSDLQANLRLDVPNRVGSDFSRHAIGNDYLLFLLTANRYPSFAVIQEPLAQFRDHSGSISTSSGRERIVTHYHLVRAYFAQAHAVAPDLVRQLNTRLRLHLAYYACEKYGIRSVADFYPEPIVVRYSPVYVLKLAASLPRRALAKLRRRLAATR